MYGDLRIFVDDKEQILHKGDVVTIEREACHNFQSENGCIFEEISTTHYLNDSFYEKSQEFIRPRKTRIHFTKDMLASINRNEK